MFGCVGSLLALPATLFVKELLQGRQETRFPIVLLSEQNVGETGIIPEDSSAESKEEQSDTYEGRHISLTVEPTYPSTNDE